MGRPPQGGDGAAELPEGLAGVVRAFRDGLPGADLEGLDDGDRLAVLHELEVATRTMAAVAARVQVGFYASQVGAQEQAGVPRAQRGRAVTDDLATARMCSPYSSSRELTAAKALCAELPRTLAALAAGVISGYQSRLVAEGTSCVDAEHRGEIDQRLAPRLPGISNRELTAAVQGLVYEVDPKGFVARARKAAQDRGVSMRPVPDVMALLSARLPAPQAIAVYRSLDHGARLKRAGGDPRTLTQLRADELYERCTGKQVVDGIDIEVGLVITDTALLQGTSDPAELLGYGPVPADYARELLRPQPDHDDGDTDHHNGDHDDGSPDGDHDGGPEGAAGHAGHQDTTHDPGTPPPSTPAAADPDDPPMQDEASRDDPDPHNTDEPGEGDPDGTDEPGEDGTDGPGAEDPEEELARAARRDGEANTNGFPGGRAPDGYCPAGGACTDAACPLTHGAPPAPGTARAQDGPASPGESAAPQSQPAGRSTQARTRTGGGSTSGRATLTGGLRAAKVFLRRLYTDPATGILTGRDPRRRLFTGSLRAFIVARDRTCRTPWCGAQIRTIDHMHRHTDGGPTTADNGQGLCERCNLARERPRALNPAGDAYLTPPPLLPCFPRPTREPSQPPGTGPEHGRSRAHPDPD